MLCSQFPGGGIMQNKGKKAQNKTFQMPDCSLVANWISFIPMAFICKLSAAWWRINCECPCISYKSAATPFSTSCDAMLRPRRCLGDNTATSHQLSSSDGVTDDVSVNIRQRPINPRQPPELVGALIDCESITPSHLPCLMAICVCMCAFIALPVSTNGRFLCAIMACAFVYGGLHVLRLTQNTKVAVFGWITDFANDGEGGGCTTACLGYQIMMVEFPV